MVCATSIKIKTQTQLNIENTSKKAFNSSYSNNLNYVPQKVASKMGLCCRPGVQCTVIPFCCKFSVSC